MSNVRPAVRSNTKPERKTDDRRDDRTGDQAGDRLVPDAVIGQHSDGVGAGPEERGMTERDDAGIAERKLEREREQDHHQQVGAEPEIAWEQEVEGDRQDPGDRLPPAQAMAAGELERCRMLGEAGRGRRHVVDLPNSPCGRHRRSRMVRA